MYFILSRVNIQHNSEGGVCMNRKDMLDFILDARLEGVGKLSDYDLKFLTQKISDN